MIKVITSCFAFYSSTRSYFDTKGWDVFRILPPEQESGSEATDLRYIGLFVKVLKVIAYIFCFVVVLGGAVVSKGTFLFMTSHIKPKRAIRHCNEDIEREHQYQAEISDTERVRHQALKLWAGFKGYQYSRG